MDQRRKGQSFVIDNKGRVEKQYKKMCCDVQRRELPFLLSLLGNKRELIGLVKEKKKFASNQVLRGAGARNTLFVCPLGDEGGRHRIFLKMF